MTPTALCALRLMALGLFKLVAVSDVLGLLVDEVFPNYRSYGGPMLVLAAVFYRSSCISTSPATPRSRGPWVCFWAWSCLKTSRRRFCHEFFRVLEPVAHQLSSWLQDYLFMPLAWADMSGVTGGRLTRLPAEVCVFTVFLCRVSGMGTRCPLWFGVCCRPATAWARSFCTAAWASPKKAPARVLWAKRAGVFVLWCISMVFFRVGSSPPPHR